MRGHFLSVIHVAVVIILTCGCEAFVHTCFNSIHDSLSLRTSFVPKKSANQLDLYLHQRRFRITSDIHHMKLYQYKDVRDIESNNYSNLRRLMKYLSCYIQSVFRSLKSNMKRFLWPGLNKFHDPQCDAPLPEQAPLGCPFFGNNILAGSKKKGSEYFYSEASARLGHPNIWRFYFMGYPVISVSGSKNVNTILQSKNFNIMGWSGDEKAKKKRKKATLYSSNSVMFEHDREKHQYLRHLLGPAFTPQSVRKGINAIVLAAEEQLSVLKKGQSVKMEDVCENFALDIAWRQIIGLDLKDQDEIARFHKAVNAYVSGVFSVWAYLPDIPFKTLLPPYRARKYLVHKIKEKIADLEANGPDGSTLSAMVYSTEHIENELGNMNRLSDEDIVENALILLVAGTETTASTLTSAISFLGLHPDKFEKLLKEQVEIMSSHGENLTPEVLDECSFLESVIQETLRIVPVSGTNLRKADETVVLDNKQIPKGSPVFCNIRLTHELDPQVNSSESWTDFCPERWLDSNTKPREDFLPFGSGSRRCIGASLAMAEIRVFLSLFARKANKFKLDGVGKSREILWRPTSIIPKPDNGVPIILDS